MVDKQEIRENELLPVLVTGANTQYKESDRAKVINYLRTKWRINVIVPDMIHDKLKLFSISKKDYDFIEYALFQISHHHFSMPTTMSSAFELGLFHNLDSEDKTTILSPNFIEQKINKKEPALCECTNKNMSKEKTNIEQSYEIGEYIKLFYNPVEYIAEISDTGYPNSLKCGKSFSIIKITNNILNKIKKKRINHYIWNYKDEDKINDKNNKLDILFNSQRITKKSDKLGIYIYIPLKQLYVYYVLYQKESKGLDSNYVSNKIIKNVLTSFKVFIEEIFRKKKEYKNRKTIKIKFYYDKEKTTQTCILLSLFFIWTCCEKENQHYQKVLGNLEDYYQDIDHSEIYCIRKIKKNNKTRDIVTYAFNENGKERRKNHIILKKRWVHDYGIEKLVHSNCHSYIKGRDYMTALSIHIKNIRKCFIGFKLDLKSFFGHVSFFGNEDWEKDKKMSLQGTVIAPLLSNIAFYNNDIKITSIVTKFNGIYSRYSDDILVTFPKNTKNIENIKKEITNIIEKSKFYINNDKSKDISSKKPFKFLGLVVRDNKIWFTNRMVKKIWKWSFEPNKYKLTNKYIENLLEEAKKNNIEINEKLKKIIIQIKKQKEK